MTVGSQNDLDPSVALRVFSILEVHRRILENLGKSDLATAARVCRTWVDLALDILWEELESINPIMALLGPISLGEDGWEWDHGFPTGHWTRFESYARRIRSLSYSSVRYANQQRFIVGMSPGVATQLLYYTAANHGQYILPQIRRIRWYGDYDSQLRMIVPFMSPKVEDIRLDVGYDVLPSETERSLRALRAMLPPGIVVLRLSQQEYQLREVVEALLEGQDRLQELQLPYQPMGPALFKPRLRVLESDLDLELGVNVERLLSQLADTCPLLEDLRIMFRRGDGGINFRAVRPLLRCSALRSLDLEYSNKFELDTKDIHEMGSAWRELEVLHVASRNLYDSVIHPSYPTFGTPLGSLAAFAESFSPKLRKLGLYLNTRHIPDPPHPSVRFPNLETFTVGTSSLVERKAHVAKAATFLRSLLPQGIRIYQSDYPGWNSALSVFDSDSLEPPTDSWRAVSQMLSQGGTTEIFLEESDWNLDTDTNPDLDADETDSLFG